MGERTWTAAPLVAWLATTYQIDISSKYLGERLHQRRFRWKRTKRTVQHKADPNRQKGAQADLAVGTV